MMETKKLTAYEKKFFISPDHYFPRFQLKLPETPDDSALSDLSDQYWEEQPYIREENWLHKIIKDYVNRTFDELGLAQTDSLMTRKTFLDYIVPLMLKNNVFDGTWSQVEFDNEWKTYARHRVQNENVNEGTLGVNRADCVNMVKRMIEYKHY